MSRVPRGGFNVTEDGESLEGHVVVRIDGRRHVFRIEVNKNKQDAEPGDPMGMDYIAYAVRQEKQKRKPKRNRRRER